MKILAQTIMHNVNAKGSSYIIMARAQTMSEKLRHILLDPIRGVGGDLILLEEAAFMPIKMFHEVIVPLLELETTALICISTPQDSSNFYSMMFEMVDQAGEKLFNQIQISMVCDDCKLGPHPEKMYSYEAPTTGKYLRISFAFYFLFYQ